MAFYVFKWVSGEIIRTFETESDKIILDSRGDDSMTLTIPWDSLTATQKDSWRGDFQGISRGIAYTENTGSSEIVLAAGQISSTPELRNGLLNVSVRSMKEFLRSVVYDPGTAITDKTSKVQHDGTAAGYINLLLTNVTSRAHLPSFGTPVGVGSGTSSHHENILRDMTSIGDIIDELADDVYGTETRFDARKTGNRIEFYARYSTSGRLINTGLNTTIDLDSPNNRLISITPKTEWGDFQTTLWHEITVDNSENENLIDIRKTSISAMGEFPEIAVFENFNSALTPEERNVQVQARLDSNSKPFEKWEVEIFEEEERGNDLVKPLTWITQDSCILGKKVAITGGAAMEAESLQANLRCLAIQFSSQTSSVLIQLATERAIYPRLVKRVIDRTPSTPTVRRPNVGVPRLPSDFDGIGGGGISPEPPVVDPTVPVPPNAGWDWGSENNPFKDGPNYVDPVYGISLSEPSVNGMLWQRGTTFPAINDNPYYTYVETAQDDEGTGFYSAWIEVSNQTGVPYQNQVGTQVFLPVENKKIKSGLTVTIHISSGYFDSGEVSDFQERGTISLSSSYLNKMYFDVPESVSFNQFQNDNFAVININQLAVYKDRLSFVLGLAQTAFHQNNPSRVAIQRLLTVKKAESGYEPINTKVYTLSKKIYIRRVSEQNSRRAASVLGPGIRIGSWLMSSINNQQFFENPKDIESWKTSVGDIATQSVTLPELPSGWEVNYPALKFEGKKYAVIPPSLSSLYPMTGEYNLLCSVAKSSISMSKSQSLYSTLKEETLPNIIFSEESLSDGGMAGSGMTRQIGPLNKDKQKDSWNVNYFGGQNTGIPFDLSNSSMVTVNGCPLLVGFTGYNTVNKMNLIVIYPTRSFMGEGFSVAKWGKGYSWQPNTPSNYSESLIPQLSYTFIEVPYLNFAQGLAKAYYYDGYLYIFPRRQTEDNEGNLSLPPYYSVKIDTLKTPLDDGSEYGNIPLNTQSQTLPPITPPQT